MCPAKGCNRCIIDARITPKVNQAKTAVLPSVVIGCSHAHVAIMGYQTIKMATIVLGLSYSNIIKQDYLSNT